MNAGTGQNLEASYDARGRAFAWKLRFHAGYSAAKSLRWRQNGQVVLIINWGRDLEPSDFNVLQVERRTG